LNVSKLGSSVQGLRYLSAVTRHPLEIARAVRVAKGAGRRGAVQYVPEFAPLLAMMIGLRPQAVVEIGTHLGGSFWAFCQVAPSDATLVSIDLPGGPYGTFAGEAAIPRLRGYGKRGQRLEFILGDSHATETRRSLAVILGDQQVDFLFIDGDHSYEGVRQDFEHFAPFVREGGLIAFHDIVPGARENVGGVPEFWVDVKGSNSIELVKDWGQGACGIGVLRQPLSEAHEAPCK
jgi:predicted O-methyltransferase YrrM